VSRSSKNEEGCWKHSRGVCCSETCQKYLTAGEGLFCANFSFGRADFPPCQGFCCPDCFKPTGNKPFLIQKAYDEEGEELTKHGDERRFLEARAGDHLMVPFQCSLCHFRNIMLRDPWEDDENDREIIEFIVRATLDSFWGRETTTVTKTLMEAKRLERAFSRLGMPSGTPPMGPFPVRDDMGMQSAIAVLDRSMDPGKYAEFVQWETSRKTRSCITNVSQAGVGGLGNMIGAYERKKMWISTVATSITHLPYSTKPAVPGGTYSRTICTVGRTICTSGGT
jgi:hypothetical protein